MREGLLIQPSVWDRKEQSSGSWKPRSTSNITSKDQSASQSLSGPHATDNPMGCQSIMQLSSFSFLRKALAGLDSCLCWSWKADMCHHLAVPNLRHVTPAIWIGTLKVWTTTFQSGPFIPASLPLCAHVDDKVLWCSVQAS